ncbi:MAG TPA: ChaN family lipoprotein, partial [Candidatus Polarisedimenticolia bacterium]|nr:ChaN family lipoprotein [Candidatus Polarisedimenticolia bacterium]
MARATPPSAQVLEEVAFQRHAVSRLRREIRNVDRNSRRRYIREFHADFRRAESRASWDDLVIACYKADIVLIGDYHALPESQQCAARLLEAIAERSTRTVLGLEMVYGRHQKVLDAYLKGDLAEEDFLRAVRYEADWGYDWPSFRRLLEVARRHGMPVYGADCGPRSGFRSIRRRDRYAADRLTRVLEAHPGSRLVVVFGESHLARGHLPLQLNRRLRQVGLEKRSVIVLQNLEEVAWGLAEEGQAGVEVARLAPDAFCVFSASPIAKYEAYRRLVETWNEEEPDSPIDLTSTVHGIIDLILKFLRVDKFTCKVRFPDGHREPLVDLFPEVHSGLDPEDLRDVLGSGGLEADGIAEVVDHVGREGSCYVPRLNAVFIGTLNLAHAGEEAGHFVNQVLKGEIQTATPEFLAQHDLFYTGVLEEALAFFASKLVDPSRNHFFESDFYQYYRKDPEVIRAHTRYEPEEFNAIIDFVLLHKKFEQSYERYTEVPAAILEGIRSGPVRANVLVHELGYFLGQQMHDAYRAGILSRAEILDLFRASFLESGSAL